MALAGNEKRIQALFHELKRADEPGAPEFMTMWKRAQARRSGSPRGFKISFAVVTTLFVITLSSLLLWSRNWRPSRLSNPGVVTVPPNPGSTSVPALAIPGSVQMVAVHPPQQVKSNRWKRKLVVRRQANPDAKNAVIRNAISISTWQSPTAMLMQSPVDDVLTSLPQLDRSLNEMKTFLPNTPQ